MKLEYKILKEKVREYNKKDAKFYGNMFAKMSKLEPVEPNVRLHSFYFLVASGFRNSHANDCCFILLADCRRLEAEQDPSKRRSQ